VLWNLAQITRNDPIKLASMRHCGHLSVYLSLTRVRRFQMM